MRPRAETSPTRPLRRRRLQCRIRPFNPQSWQPSKTIANVWRPDAPSSRSDRRLGRQRHSFVRAFGDADLAKKVPLTPADHFRIGSNTKTFVVSVLLQLVAEKKLRLDDPLGRFS